MLLLAVATLVNIGTMLVYSDVATAVYIFDIPPSEQHFAIRHAWGLVIIGGLFGTPVMGIIAQAFGARPSLGVSCFLAAAGSILCALTVDDEVGFAVGRVVAGWGANAAYAVVTLYVTDFGQDSDHAVSTLGVANAVSTAGFVLAGSAAEVAKTVVSQRPVSVAKTVVSERPATWGAALSTAAIIFFVSAVVVLT